MFFYQSTLRRDVIPLLQHFVHQKCSSYKFQNFSVPQYIHGKVQPEGESCSDLVNHATEGAEGGGGGIIILEDLLVNGYSLADTDTMIITLDQMTVIA